MIPLRNMVTQYVDDDEAIKLATAAAKKMIRKEVAADVSEKLLYSALALTVPLAIGGIGIGMREGIQRYSGFVLRSHCHKRRRLDCSYFQHLEILIFFVRYDIKKLNGKDQR